MTEQTEQTEWRSGDVVVHSGGLWDWGVRVGGHEPWAIPKELCPDPQALAEFVASQQPKPRFYVDLACSGPRGARLKDRTGEGTVRVTMYALDLDARTIAEHLAAWLNAQEADR